MSYVRLGTVLLAFGAINLLQACSQMSASRSEYEQGWREAFVVNADVGSRPVEQVQRDCRSGPDASGRYAVLSYLDRAHHRVRYVAPVPQAVQPAEGQAYRVRVDDCASAWRSAAR